MLGSTYSQSFGIVAPIAVTFEFEVSVPRNAVGASNPPNWTRDAAIPRGNRAMKDEYDFSNAERGKFFRRDAQLIPPLHLDPEVLSYLAERAEARGTSLNELLKKDIELIEAAR
jgi:hypothetical protein